MGLFDLFGADVSCPRCGDRGARRSLWGSLKCPNHACDHFSQELADATIDVGRADQTGSAARRERPTKALRSAARFDPGVYRIDVHYVNHANEPKTFVGDRRTLCRRGTHVSLRVMPTGTRIALANARIENFAEIEAALDRLPSPQERRILKFHAWRGTTSARHAELRQKYADWTPPALA